MTSGTLSCGVWMAETPSGRSSYSAIKRAMMRLMQEGGSTRQPLLSLCGMLPRAWSCRKRGHVHAERRYFPDPFMYVSHSALLLQEKLWVRPIAKTRHVSARGGVPLEAHWSSRDSLLVGFSDFIKTSPLSPATLQRLAFLPQIKIRVAMLLRECNGMFRQRSFCSARNDEAVQRQIGPCASAVIGAAGKSSRNGLAMSSRKASQLLI